MKTLRTLLLGMAVCAVLLVGGCFWLPNILSAMNPGVLYRVPDAGKTLFLTLDDGPSEATPQILEVLRKHDVHATFFITTDHIHPDIMWRISAEGHLIANHLKAVTSLGRLSDAQFKADFAAADKALSGFNSAKFFRPPGGSISSDQVKYAASRDYTVVVGTVFPLDHWLENNALIEMLAKALVIDGGIIILHDTNTRGPKTAALLDTLIPELKNKGYQFELLPAHLTPSRF